MKNFLAILMLLILNFSVISCSTEEGKIRLKKGSHGGSSSFDDAELASFKKQVEQHYSKPGQTMTVQSIIEAVKQKFSGQRIDPNSHQSQNSNVQKGTKFSNMVITHTKDKDQITTQVEIEFGESKKSIKIVGTNDGKSIVRTLRGDSLIGKNMCLDDLCQIQFVSLVSENNKFEPKIFLLLELTSENLKNFYAAVEVLEDAMVVGGQIGAKGLTLISRPFEYDGNPISKLNFNGISQNDIVEVEATVLKGNDLKFLQLKFEKETIKSKIIQDFELF